MNKKILIIACLAIMVVTFSGCGLQGDDENKKTTVEQNQNQEKNESNDKNKDSANNIAGNADIIDCGISSTGSTDGKPVPMDERGYENDSAMVCMGNSILDNCKKAKVIVRPEEGTVISYEVVGLKGKECIIRIEHQKGTQILEKEKYLEGTYTECSVDVEDLQSGDKRDYLQMPGLFAAELHLLLIFETLMEDTKCTGTMGDAYQAMVAEEE